MTVADTVYDTINDNWGGGGYGGATPEIDVTETQHTTDTVTGDLIEVRHYTLREAPRPVNDTYTNRYYTIDVYVQSKTTNAQLKLLVDEAEYLLRNTAMTDLSLLNITKDWNVMRWRQGVHACVLRVELVSWMSSGAITPAAGTTANMQSLLMYTSANAAWVPCGFDIGGPLAKYQLSTFFIAGMPSHCHTNAGN